jgi:type VI protein secretion system component Hcp
MRSIHFRFARSLLLFVASIVLLPHPSAGEIRVFLTYEGLPENCGSALEEGYAGQIVVRSFGELLGYGTNDSGLPIGKSPSRSIEIAKDMDRCSPAIFLDTVSGRTIDTMTIRFVTFPTGLNFATIDAQQVQVTAMNLSTAGATNFDNGGSLNNLFERLTFAINKQLLVTFRQILPDGTLGPPVTSCWDFRYNRAC